MNILYLTVIIIFVIILILVGLILLFRNKNKNSKVVNDVPPQHESNIKDGKLPERYPNVNSYQFISGNDHNTNMYRFIDNNVFIVRRGSPFTITNSIINMNSIKYKAEKLENEYRYRFKKNPNSTDKNDKLNVKKSGQPAAVYTPVFPAYSIKFEGLYDRCSSFTTIPLETNNIRELSRTANSITFDTNVNSSIGHYRLSFSDNTVIELYVIFNPYHKDDNVYMEKSEDLDEYLLNEHGFVFKGTLAKPDYSLIWDYAQFDEICFLSIMGLLAYLEGYEDYNGSDPASVSRNLAYAISNNVIIGNWNDNSKDPNFVDIKCDTLQDCSLNYNLCQQPALDDTKPYQKVCGMTYTGNKKTDTFLQDVIPLINDDNYRTCVKDDDCKDITINLPPTYDNDMYQKKCVNSKLCGYDVYYNNETNPTKRYISPYTWTSSRDIYINYYNTVDNKGQKCNRENSQCQGYVQYGQCWVFAALLNTSFRTLGIPSRQLCCYNASHEYCNTLLPYPSAIVRDSSKCHIFPPYEGDKQLVTSCEIGMASFTGKLLIPTEQVGNTSYSMNGSIWSFHNWNEAWFNRPEIPKYNGFDWNVVDSTPQELSYGLSTCGPAPKKAIRDNINNKNADIPYDVSFISAEVNYSNVTVTIDENNNIKYPDTLPPDAITLVVTSRPHILNIVNNTNLKLGDIQEDLTDTYKYTKSPSLSFLQQNSSNKMVSFTTTNNIIMFNLEYLPFMTGDVKISIIGSFAQYNGDIIKQAIKFETTIPCLAKQKLKFEKQFNLSKMILPSLYIISKLSIIFPDNDNYFDIKYLHLKPINILTISMPNNKMKINKLNNINVKLQNPYDNKPLLNCILTLHSKYITIDGEDIEKTIHIANVKPNDKLDFNFNLLLEKLIPISVNKSIINISFACDTIPETIHQSQIIYF